MKKIPTAKDMVDKWQDIVLNNIKSEIQDDYSLENTLIEFAKLHVEAALKEASEEATINKNKGEVIARTFGNVINGTYSVNKQSILNSYSLDNIK